jgi:hypothetical protein
LTSLYFEYCSLRGKSVLQEQMARSQEFYEEDWTGDEKLLFDEFVRDEMKRLEGQMKAEFHAATGEDYGNASVSPGKLSKDRNESVQNHKLYAGQGEWSEAQRRIQTNTNANSAASIPNQQRKPEYKYDENDSANQANRRGPSSNHISMDFDSKPIDHRGNAYSDKIARQKEFARQLQADQDRNATITIAAAPKKDNYAYDRNDSRNSYSTGYNSNDTSPRPSDSGGYNKSTLGNSGRNIFSDRDAGSEAEAKRQKQRKYYEDLTASATAAPIPEDRQSRRKAPSASGEAGVSLNIGGQSVDDRQLYRSQKQRTYADQISEAANRAPIPAEHVRKNRAKEEVGGGAIGYGGADMLTSPAKHLIRRNKQEPEYGEGQESRSNSSMSMLPSERVTDNNAEARRMRQLEYSRQLRDDAEKPPMLSPRSSLHRNRTKSPEADVSNLNPRSPSGAFVRGLATNGPSTSQGQRKTQQQQYAEALDRDRAAKATLQTSSSEGNASYRTISPVVAQSGLQIGNSSSQANQVSNKDRQRQYAEALDRDRSSAPVSTNRARMVRVMSPNSGVSKLVPDTYGKRTDGHASNSYQEEPDRGYSHDAVDKVQRQFDSMNVSSGSYPDRANYGRQQQREEEYPSQQASYAASGANQQDSDYDDDAERRYQLFAEKMRQERRTKDEGSMYDAVPAMNRPPSGRTQSNPAGARAAPSNVPYDTSSSYGQGGSNYNRGDEQPRYLQNNPYQNSNAAGNFTNQSGSQMTNNSGVRQERSDSRNRGRSSGGGASSFSIGGY